MVQRHRQQYTNSHPGVVEAHRQELERALGGLEMRIAAVEAEADELVGAAGTVIVREQDGSPTVTTGTIEFDQAAGISVTDVSGVARVSAAVFTATVRGLAPLSGAPTGLFLRDDATWAAAGGGSGIAFTLAAAMHHLGAV